MKHVGNVSQSEPCQVQPLLPLSTHLFGLTANFWTFKAMDIRIYKHACIAKEKHVMFTFYQAIVQFLVTHVASNGESDAY
jgi:hypothetical protein